MKVQDVLQTPLCPDVRIIWADDWEDKQIVDDLWNNWDYEDCPWYYKNHRVICMACENDGTLTLGIDWRE